MDVTSVSMPLWMAILIVVLAGFSLWIGWKLIKISGGVLKAFGRLLGWLGVSLGVGSLVPITLILLFGTWESGIIRIGLTEPVRVILGEINRTAAIVQTYIDGGGEIRIGSNGSGIGPTPTPMSFVPPTAQPSAPTQAPPQSVQSQVVGQYPTCQQVLNAFADEYGRQNYWARVAAAGVQSCADSESAREAPFTQPEKLPVEVASRLSWPVVATVVPTQPPQPTPTSGPPPTPVPTSTPDPYVQDQDRLNEYYNAGDREGAEQYCRYRDSDVCQVIMSQIDDQKAAWQRLNDYLVTNPQPGDANWLEGVAQRLPEATYRSVSLGWGKWQIEVIGSGWLSGLRTEIPRQFLNAIGHKSDGEVWPYFQPR